MASIDLDPVEVVKRIETAGAWMVLKRVENSPGVSPALGRHPAYRWRGRADSTACSNADFETGRGVLVCVLAEFDDAVPSRQRRQFSSCISTAKKFFTIFDNNDRALVVDEEIERSMTKHRNLKYDERFAPRGAEFQLFAGDGC